MLKHLQPIPLVQLKSKRISPDHTFSRFPCPLCGPWNHVFAQPLSKNKGSVSVLCELPRSKPSPSPPEAWMGQKEGFLSSSQQKYQRVM